jgi:UDP-N-acetylglucosamine--N-acetylmuramyl-(pentapeptide) pyrophosphoryl-undecaprenol N-acetylglucosamine transferase
VVRVLILGGSQGALALNELVPAALDRLSSDGNTVFEVIHQTGKGKEERVQSLYQSLRVSGKVQVRAFLDDIPQRLVESDLVIARAGAGTVAEISAIGRASLLIPYPFAADDHQRRNAESMAKLGAAICVPQADASVERLVQELQVLIHHPARRTQMAKIAQEHGRPQAALEIAEDLLQLATKTSWVPGTPTMVGV